MSVVFVVTVQWPTGTNMTSPFILFLNTCPFSMSLKTIHSASNQICKILGKSDAWQWKSLKHFVLSSPLKWIVDEVKNNSTCKCTLVFKGSTRQMGGVFSSSKMPIMYHLSERD